jgi:hypothetical protein
MRLTSVYFLDCCVCSDLVSPHRLIFPSEENLRFAENSRSWSLYHTQQTMPARIFQMRLNPNPHHTATLILARNKPRQSLMLYALFYEEFMKRTIRNFLAMVGKELRRSEGFRYPKA